MLKHFKTYWIAVDFYQSTRKLKLPRHLRDQLDRAASSIALNLAEGAGKSSCKDQCRFFDIAFGSTKESQAILEISGFENSDCIELADKLAAHLYRLIQSYRKADSR